MLADEKKFHLAEVALLLTFMKPHVFGLKTHMIGFATSSRKVEKARLLKPTFARARPSLQGRRLYSSRTPRKIWSCN